jgi:hypothetical protein
MDTGAWQGGFDRLNLQVVAPTLESGEEAVGIGESFPFPQPEIGQADLMGVVVEDQAARVADAVLLAAHGEPVQVLPAPAEGDLEDLVQTGDSDRVGDLHLTPDQRADPGQHHPQPVDRSGPIRHRRLSHRDPSAGSFDKKHYHSKHSPLAITTSGDSAGPGALVLSLSQEHR